MPYPSRPKSDAQLDAEAADPELSTEPLADLILAHRIAFRRDLYIPRTTTETPPVFIDPQTGEPVADPMSMTGPTLSYPMLAYLHATGPFPWTRSFARMRSLCRRTHTRGHHEHASWRGSLCGALVGLVIRQDYAFDRACYDLYVSPERAEPVLRRALATIKDRMLELAERAEGVRYAGPIIPESVPVHEHHRLGLDGLHHAECPHPVCKARRAA